MDDIDGFDVLIFVLVDVLLRIITTKYQALSNPHMAIKPLPVRGSARHRISAAAHHMQEGKGQAFVEILGSSLQSHSGLVGSVWFGLVRFGSVRCGNVLQLYRPLLH